MKSLVVLMTVMAASLAATSIYLLKQLAAARAGTQQVEQQLVALKSRLEETAQQLQASRVAAANAPPASVRPASPAAAAPPDAAPSAPAPRARHDPYARTREMLREPSSRALLRADRIASLKAKNADMARQMQLTDAEYQELIEFLADQALQRDVSVAKNHAGVPGHDYFSLQQRERRELEEFLGEERAKQYRRYQAGAFDRAQVSSLRGRLGELDVLTDEQATTLAAALQEEREQYNKDIEAQYGTRATYVMEASGLNLMATGSNADEDAMEQQLRDEVEGYSRRVRDRAATVLTSRQMKVFNEMQDAQLASNRVLVRSLRETPVQAKAVRQ